MAVTFGCICAAVAVGTLIRRRLHEHHLTSPTQEVVKVSAGIVATLTALVLGLLVGGSKQFYEQQGCGTPDVRSEYLAARSLDEPL